MELKGYKAVYQTLCTAASVEEAAIAVLTGFEKPADQGTAVRKKRTEYGQMFYEKYAGNATGNSVPFKVKVEIPDLNIRTGAGTNYPKTGKHTGTGVFTIVEIQSGQGARNGWGKLKSGLGWISLDYVIKI